MEKLPHGGRVDAGANAGSLSYAESHGIWTTAVFSGLTPIISWFIQQGSATIFRPLYSARRFH